MADVARQLLSKVVLERDLVTVLTAGVRADWFEDDEHKRVFKWMLDYFNRYSTSPTHKALRLEFPTYRVIRTDEPYEFYIDQFRDQRHRSILIDTVIDVNEALDDGEIKEAQNKLTQGLSRVGAEISSLTDVDLVSSWREHYDEYDKARQFVGELTGIPTGFPSIDLVTGGFHDEQFVLFAGAQKMGKSWMMMKSAIAAQEQAKKVLFITFEMSEREQKCRHYALTCGLDSNKLLQNKLNDKDMLRMKRGMRQRENLPPFVVSADITATTTPSGLAGKIQEHQPDIVFIDGVYLMENEIGAESGTPQAYTSLSRSLKRLAQRIKRPVIGSMQALPSKMNREGRVTMHSLAWSSSWGQDADLVIGVERIEGAPLITMRIVGGRNVSPIELRVSCNWNESIFDEYDEEEQSEG